MPLTTLAELRTGCAGRLAVHGERWIVCEAGCAELHERLEAPARTLPAGHGLAAAFDAAGTRALIDFWAIPLDGGEPVAVPQLALAGGPAGGFSPRALAWAPDGGELLAAATAAALLHPGAPPAHGWRLAVLDPATGELRAQEDGADDNAPQHLVCTDDAVITAGPAGVARRDRALGPLAPPDGTSGVQALAAGGAIAAAVTAAGELLILAGDRPAVRVSAHPARGTAVAVSSDGGLVVTGDEDGAVRAFSPTGELFGDAVVGGRVEGLAAGPDGLILAAWRPGAERRVAALRA